MRMTGQKSNSQTVESAPGSTWASEPGAGSASAAHRPPPVLVPMPCQLQPRMHSHPSTLPYLLPQHHNRGHKRADTPVRMTRTSHATKPSATLMGTARHGGGGEWPKTAWKMHHQGHKGEKGAIHLLRQTSNRATQSIPGVRK